MTEKTLTSHPKAVGSGKNLLGVWALESEPLSLGGALIFAAELALQAGKSEEFDVCVVERKGQPLQPLFGGREKTIELDDNETDRFPALRVLKNLAGMKKCYYAPSYKEFQEFTSNRSGQLWPDSSKETKLYRYSNTRRLQEWFADRGWNPRVACKPELIGWANDFLSRHVTPAVSITVHLKNVPGQSRQSNADFDAWLEFFRRCAQQKFNTRFVLISDDPVDGRIRGLPNVLIARDNGSDIVRDMALIQASAAFMGMASGPCLMAALGEHPYVIFKNPDHHPEEMVEEIGQSDRYPFSLPSQRLLRESETPEILMAEFTRIMGAIKAGETGA